MERTANSGLSRHRGWIENVNECNIAPINAFANSVFKNITGIANSMITKISNGVAEGINSVVQLVKSRARGFWNIRNFINMIYLLGNDFRFSTLNSKEPILVPKNERKKILEKTEN